MQVLNHFQEVGIERIVVRYNWNAIMVQPKLVCYDKNQWKTLQQVNNWNREWNELFSTCFALRGVELHINVTWMNDDFARLVLEGVAKLPNIQEVSATFVSKNGKVEELLEAFQKANIFPQYRYQFVKLE